MPVLLSPDLDDLRNRQQKAYAYAWFLVPRTLWSARVNDPGIGREETEIVFDGGSGTFAFSAIEPVQEAWIGTAAGLDDIGRVRIRAITSGDGGVTGLLTVAENPLVWADNAHISFKHDYPLKPVYSRLGNDGTFYKDGDVVYSDQNKLISPSAVGGEHRVGRLVAGSVTFNLPVGESYALTPGATITGRTVSVYPSAGVTVGAYGAGVIPVTITIMGQYWAKITITDSNGQSQVTYRSLVALNPLGQSQVTGGGILLSNKAWSDFQYSDDWGQGGKSLALTLHDKATLAYVPDNTLCVLFQRAWYGTTERNITFSPDEANTLMVGYVRKENIERDLERGPSYVDLTVQTVEAQLAKHNFSVSLEAMPSDPTVWYQYITNLTAGRAAHHFLSEHSTVMYNTDVLGLVDNLLPRAFAQFQAGTILEIVNSLCYDTGIRAKFVSDKGGRLRLTPDVQLLTDSQRAALPVIADLAMVDYRESFNIDRQWIPRVPAVYTSGFAWDNSFIVSEETGNLIPDVEPLCAKAPGTVELDDGTNPANYDRQTYENQTHANQIAARFLARDNNIYPEFTPQFKGNLLGVLDTAYAEFWRTSIAVGDTARGIVLTAKKLILRNVVGRLDGSSGVLLIQATFELEAEQAEGVPGNCMDELPSTVGDPVPVPPLPDDLGGAIVTASSPASVHYLPPGSPDWVQRTNQATLDLRVDPYWRVKTNSSRSADAIWYRCGQGFVKREEDAGLTSTVITPPDPPNDAADAPAPLASQLTYAVLDVSWTHQDRLAVLSYWQNGAAKWRTWLNLSDDEGATWTQIQLTAGPGSGPTIVPDNVAGADWETNSGNRFRVIAPTSGSIMIVRNTTSSYATTNLSIFGIDISGTVINSLNMGGSSLLKSLIELSGGGFVISRDTSAIRAVCNYITGSVAGGFVNASSVNIPHNPFNDASDPHVAPLTGTTFMAAYVGQSDLVHPYGAYFTIGTIVAGAISFPASSSAVIFEPFTPPGETIVIFDLVPISSTEAMVVYSKSGSGTFARLLNSSGTVGAAIAISGVSLGNTNKPAVIPYGSGILICGTNGGNVRLVEVSTGGAVSSPSDIIAGSNPVITEIGGVLFVAYNDVGTGKMVSVLPDGVGGFVAEDDEAVYDSTSAAGKFILDYGGDPTIVYNNGVVTLENRINRAVYTPGSGIGGGDGFTFKGLGLAFSRQLGELVWVTAWAGEVLLLIKYDDSLAFQDYYEMGGAAEVEIGNKTWIAYPHAPFSDEDICNVFGRLDDPQGLGLAHIIRTLDGGATWEVYENSWGSHYCAALLISPTGTRYAIRSLGATAKLYTGTAALSLRSSIPFGGAVEPHGLAVENFEDAVVVGASLDNNKMVVLSLPPYSSWADITTNHETTAGINSVEVL